GGASTLPSSCFCGSLIITSCGMADWRHAILALERHAGDEYTTISLHITQNKKVHNFTKHSRCWANAAQRSAFSRAAHIDRYKCKHKSNFQNRSDLARRCAGSAAMRCW